ncbi:hypothetical protein [Methanimicrococcus hongohii]|uniref:hypothetical protein n=1 Tax=Methanimicrococcus hongohii TaxID=3028295 RepID=UPI00292F7574|nr:hypothetical protein [Methanimicrococcus sp. Hf6]
MRFALLLPLRCLLSGVCTRAFAARGALETLRFSLIFELCPLILFLFQQNFTAAAAGQISVYRDLLLPLPTDTPSRASRTVFFKKMKHDPPFNLNEKRKQLFSFYDSKRISGPISEPISE